MFFIFFQATELIKENIKLQNELGRKAQDILLKGGALPEEMVAKMIDEKIKSPECEHHGNYGQIDTIEFLKLSFELTNKAMCLTDSRVKATLDST